jgi:hypothetical protein
MSRKCASFILFVWILFLFIAGPAGAQEYYVQLYETSSTPVFMNGHDGDWGWIVGVNIDMDIYWGGTKIGSATGNLTMMDPPVNFNAIFSTAKAVFTYSIDGWGSFQQEGDAIIVFNSNTGTDGSFHFSSQARIFNGTGSYTDWYGTAVSSGSGSLYMTGSTILNEVWYFQYGF